MEVHIDQVPIRYDMTTLTCARKLAEASLINCTEAKIKKNLDKKRKTKNKTKTDMLKRNAKDCAVSIKREFTVREIREKGKF